MLFGTLNEVLKSRIECYYEYDAFGNVVQSEEKIRNIFRFTGEQYDQLTGQYYLKARYYNPVIGQFTQMDTYLGDGLNLYAYVQNNPVRYVDPSGHCKEGIVSARNTVGSETRYGKSSGKYSGADNIADAVRLKEYYRQAEKYGTGSIKELQDGRFRFYEDLKLAKKQGEMVGARHVREWNPYTDYKRDWYETLDHYGNIRQVRPDPNITGGIKVHYMFDIDGVYTGNWIPNK